MSGLEDRFNEKLINLEGRINEKLTHLEGRFNEKFAALEKKLDGSTKPLWGFFIALLTAIIAQKFI